MPKNYWLVKSDPEEFSLSDLKRSPKSTTGWDGVRNYQARNYIKEGMRKGDKVLFYHSNCESPGIEGVAEVVREAYPDDTSWNPKSRHFDPASRPEAPRWFQVDLQWKVRFRKRVTLQEIKTVPELRDMRLLMRGNRLSVMPITALQFKKIYEMGN